jgi:archaellum component FlaC
MSDRLKKLREELSYVSNNFGRIVDQMGEDIDDDTRNLKIKAAAMAVQGKEYVKDKLNFSKEEIKTIGTLVSKISSTAAKVKTMYEELTGLQKSINALAKEAEKEGKDSYEKRDKYVKMYGSLLQIGKHVKGLKEQLDKLAKNDDSKVTEALGTALSKAEKIEKLLKFTNYLADDRTLKAYHANPNNFKAAKAWAEHAGKGFELIAGFVDFLPDKEPIGSLKKYYKGMLKAGPALIKAFSNAIELRLKQLDEADGDNYTDYKHKTDKYAGAMMPLFVSFRNNTETLGGYSMTMLLDEDRTTLMNADNPIKDRISHIKAKIVILKSKNPADAEIADRWLKQIEDLRAHMEQLAVNELH